MVSLKRLCPVCLIGASLTWVSGCVDSLIFPAPRSGYGASEPGLVALDRSPEPPIAAKWLPVTGARKTVLFFHGNATDIGYSHAMLQTIRARTGYSVLAVDYPGYGLSRGRPSESGCYDAAESGYDWLVNRCGVAPGDIVVWGQSVGSGPAVELSVRRPVGALVLVSPFTSAFRVASRAGALLPFDRFENVNKIGDVKAPLLVVHGDADEVVPYSHGVTLHASAEKSSRRLFLTVRGGGHNNLESAGGAAMYGAISEFLREERADAPVPVTPAP